MAAQFDLLGDVLRLQQRGLRLGEFRGEGPNSLRANQNSLRRQLAYRAIYGHP